MARSERLGPSVVCILVFVAAACGATTDPSVEAGGSAEPVTSVAVDTAPAVPTIADPTTKVVLAYVPDGYVFESELRPKTDHGNLVILDHYVEAVGNRPTPGGPIGRGDVTVTVVNVPGLAARNVNDPASLIEPGGDMTLESRTSIQGVPAAVLAESVAAPPIGPIINHHVTFARGDWRFEIISPTVTVDELIRVAEGVSLQ